MTESVCPHTNARAHALLFAVEEVVDVFETVVDSTTDFHGDQVLITCPLPKRGGTDMESVHHFLLRQKDIFFGFLPRSIFLILCENESVQFTGKSNYAFVCESDRYMLFTS